MNRRDAAMGQQPIKVPADSDLAVSLKAATAGGEPLTVDLGDGLYTVFIGRRIPRDVPAGDAAHTQAAIRAASGSWKNLDVETFKAYLTERRHTASRPSVEW